jgi:hypothetical protein
MSSEEREKLIGFAQGLHFGREESPVGAVVPASHCPESTSQRLRPLL